jgi:hypothetical protein
LKGKRAKKNPLVKKGRFNEYAPFTCGLHVVLLIAPGQLSCAVGLPAGATQKEQRLPVGE